MGERIRHLLHVQQISRQYQRFSDCKSAISTFPMKKYAIAQNMLVHMADIKQTVLRLGLCYKRIKVKLCIFPFFPLRGSDSCLTVSEVPSTNGLRSFNLNNLILRLHIYFVTSDFCVYV
jgi:hypothetical protein